MQKNRKIILWAAGGLGSVAALLAILILLLPTIVSEESIKAKILAEIRNKTGAQAGFGNLSLSFSPMPHLTILEGTLIFPEEAGIAASVKRLTAEPKILPLLTGSVLIKRLRLESPAVTIREKRAKKTDEVPPPADGKGPESSMADRISAALTKVSSKASGLTVVIEDGAVSVLGEPEAAGDENAEFLFSGINAQVTLGGMMEVDLAARSNLWESLSIKGRISPADLGGSGHVTLTGFRPESLADRLRPNAALRVGDSLLNLDIAYEGKNANTYQTKLTGTVPLLTLHKGDEILEIKGGSLDTLIDRNGERLAFNIVTLSLDQPRTDLTFKLIRNPAGSESSLDIEGRDMDADAVRKAALFLAPENRVVEKVFNIVRGGHVPLITYNAKAPAASELGKFEHFVLKGSLEGGRVMVPKVNLDVENAMGEVLISQGILDATKLFGKTGNSLGNNGTLKIGLRDGDVPFHLDIGLDADLSQLPAILNRVVKNERFLEDIALIDNPQGRAQGRLILGETIKDIHTRVEAQHFELSGNYRRLPYPSRIEGGPFVYEGSIVSIQSAGGSMGKSTFKNASALIKWGEDSRLEVASTAPAHLVLDELYPW
ncbi:MAG: hypothetical protein ACLGPL_03505, partial [Acidobacteriota bacterium]